MVTCHFLVTLVSQKADVTTISAVTCNIALPERRCSKFGPGDRTARDEKLAGAPNCPGRRASINEVERIRGILLKVMNLVRACI